MELSVEGLAFLVGWEGFKAQASRDQGGHLDIGYGHLLTLDELNTGEIKLGNRLIAWTGGITERDARDIMRHDIAVFEHLVQRLTSTIPVEQYEFDAMVVFAYNIGAQAFKSSTMLKRLLAGNIDGALDAWAWFNKVTQNGDRVVSKGLKKRREAEIKLYETADYSGRP